MFAGLLSAPKRWPLTFQEQMVSLSGLNEEALLHIKLKHLQLNKNLPAPNFNPFIEFDGRGFSSESSWKILKDDESEKEPEIK